MDLNTLVLYLNSTHQFVLSYEMLCSELKRIKRIRRRHLKNILYLQRKNAVLLTQMIKLKNIRTVWRKVLQCCFTNVHIKFLSFVGQYRGSNFWEEEIPKMDEATFKESIRMNRRSFNILCEKLRGMGKRNSNFGKPIPIHKRIAIALYALGSSAEYRTIGNVFGVSKSTVCCILLEFCEKVWEIMQPDYFSSFPLSEENIRENIKGFEMLGFPQCIGALDGCHIEIRPRSEDAVDYYNYKGWYSTVLLALVDYRYRFMYVNVGCPGRCNDSQIYEKSSLKRQLQSPLLRENERNISGVNVPALIIADSAFRFSETLMKPYPFSITSDPNQKHFNYVLSKCRRVVENAFGHLKARFRRIGKGIDNSIDNASSIIKCCTVLHNFLNRESDQINTKWIQLLREEERNQGRQQPHFNETVNDLTPNAENFRAAIARHLGN